MKKRLLVLGLILVSIIIIANAQEFEGETINIKGTGQTFQLDSEKPSQLTFKKGEPLFEQTTPQSDPSLLKLTEYSDEGNYKLEVVQKDLTNIKIPNTDFTIPSVPSGSSLVVSTQDGITSVIIEQDPSGIRDLTLPAGTPKDIIVKTRSQEYTILEDLKGDLNIPKTGDIVNLDKTKLRLENGVEVYADQGILKITRGEVELKIPEGINYEISHQDFSGKNIDIGKIKRDAETVCYISQSRTIDQLDSLISNEKSAMYFKLDNNNNVEAMAAKGFVHVTAPIHPETTFSSIALHESTSFEFKAGTISVDCDERGIIGISKGGKTQYHQYYDTVSGLASKAINNPIGLTNDFSFSLKDETVTLKSEGTILTSVSRIDPSKVRKVGSTAAGQTYYTNEKGEKIEVSPPEWEEAHHPYYINEYSQNLFRGNSQVRRKLQKAFDEGNFEEMLNILDNQYNRIKEHNPSKGVDINLRRQQLENWIKSN